MPDPLRLPVTSLQGCNPCLASKCKNQDCKVTGKQGCNEIPGPGGMGGNCANDAHINYSSEKNSLDRALFGGSGNKKSEGCHKHPRNGSPLIFYDV
jgi:hypothetical protein